MAALAIGHRAEVEHTWKDRCGADVHSDSDVYAKCAPSYDPCDARLRQLLPEDLRAALFHRFVSA